MQIKNEKDAKKFYDSKQWKIKRLEILQRDRFECQDCRKRLEDAVTKGIILPASEREIRRAENVHHIKELLEFPELALDDDNLISLCIQCHNIRHGRHPKRFVRKKKMISEEKW